MKKITEEDLVELRKGYAPYLLEAYREKLGFDAEDTSHDIEVFEYIMSGEKLSKSKHMK